MSAALQLVEDFDIEPVDVRNNPVAYRNQVALAQMIVRFIEKMPLDDMSRIAHENTTPKADLHVIEILASAQRQLTRVARDA